MAHLRFVPSNKQLLKKLQLLWPQIVKALENSKTGLPSVGVASNDIVLCMEKCITTKCTLPHIEIVLKTGSKRVTIKKVFTMLSPIIKIPFEISRFYVDKDNWTSNY